MQGIVLWFNPEARVGLIWCSDQGPLAYLGPDVGLPQGRDLLDCGDQLVISVELREGVRYVRDVYAVTPGAPDADPGAILAGYHDRQERAKHLRIVA